MHSLLNLIPIHGRYLQKEISENLRQLTVCSIDIQFVNMNKISNILFLLVNSTSNDMIHNDIFLIHYIKDYLKEFLNVLHTYFG